MGSQSNPTIANIDRLNEHLDRAGCSALVLRSGKNFTYLAGFAFPGTLGRHLDFPDSPREVMLVWPRTGKPVMVLNSFSAPLARRDSWITEIEVYDDYAESPYSRMKDILIRMGLDQEKVGFEKSYLSAQRWEEIQGLLPKAEMIDCTELMDRVRWVKTKGEVDLLVKAADMLDEAYLEVFPQVREGDTEREVHSRIIQSCIEGGANWAHGILNTSRNTVVYGGEGDMEFRKGDIIRNDYVSYYQGYPGHQSRTVVVGPPTDEQKRIYREMRDIYRGTIDQCRIGAKGSGVYQFAANQFKESGYEGKVALAGHSVGAWWHQQEPYLVASCPYELEEGMVLALEPHIGYWHLQDMVLVTSDGPKLLSAKFNTDEMLVAG